MSVNWREIDLILEELDVAGSYLRDMHQPSHDALVFDVYRPGERSKLYFCFANQDYRMHRLTRKLTNPSRPPRFVSFLRANIRGGRVSEATQIGRERIIKMVVERDESVFLLWIRLWGAASNMIVTDADGTVLDAFFRRPKRGEVSGGVFRPVFDCVSAGGAEKGRDFTIRELPGSGSFNERLEAYYFDRADERQRERLVQALQRESQQRESRVLAKLETLRKKRQECESFERYREIGDLVMSNVHCIRKGEGWLTTEDFFNGNRRIDIELKPNLSPIENAEVYYQLHRKAKMGLENLESEIAQRESELAVAIDVRERILACEDLETLRRLRAETKTRRTGVREAGTPGVSYVSNGWRILIGRNARENDELLRKHVRGNDYWFHARDYPGAYVFVAAARGKSVPLEVMVDAGTCALHYSRGKESGRGDVYYTQVKHLRRVKEGRRGQVIPTQEKNLFIQMDPNRMQRLKKSTGNPSV